MSTPFDHFEFKGGVLHAEQVPLPQIASQTGTPVYIYSAEGFLNPLRELNKGLSSVDHRVCYAVKANSNVAILRLLANNGAGMDLVSGGELFRAGMASVEADRIVFSGVGKTPGEMADALEYQGRGIFSFNVESAEELQTLNAVASQMGKRAHVAFRFNPDVDAKTHPYISTGLKKNKFGMDLREIREILPKLRELSAIEVSGISIHIGSQLLSLSPMDDAFKKVRQLMVELDKKLPKPISHLDLGGGVGISYRNEKPPKVQDYCRLILKHFGPRAGIGRPIRLMLEPGRMLSGNSGVLLTEVLYRKERKAKDFLVVDAAMNDLIRPSLYESYHEIVPVEKARSASKKKTDVVGPVCETGDFLARDRSMPKSLSQGDLLAVLSAGAYGFTMSSNYNSRPRVPEVLVQGSKFQVIRTRETYEDLIRGESIETDL